MPHSLKNNLAIAFSAGVLSITSGCATSSYEILPRSTGRSGILVTGDRIIFSCEDVQDPKQPVEEDGRYGFMIWVLDNQNTATNFVQTSIITKKDCMDRIAMFEKQKRNSNKFYIAGWDDIEEIGKKSDHMHSFPGKGIFPENGKSISFTIFKADSGECFTKNFGSGKPCPKVEGFPEAEKAFSVLNLK